MSTGQTWHLRLFDKTATTLLAVLPDGIECSASKDLDDVGQLTAAYPRNGYGADTLLATKTGYIGLWEDGVDTAERFRFDGDADDEADAALNERVLSLSCQGAATALKDGIVYPEKGLNTNPWFNIINSTVGYTIRVLLEQMQARGTLLILSLSFTDAEDTAGNPWPDTMNLRYEAGKSLLDICKDLSGRGVCDWEVVANPLGGLLLNAYAPLTTMAQDRGGMWRINQATSSGAVWDPSMPQTGEDQQIGIVNYPCPAGTATRLNVRFNAAQTGDYTISVTGYTGTLAITVDGVTQLNGTAFPLKHGLHVMTIDNVSTGAGTLTVRWVHPGAATGELHAYPMALLMKARDVLSAPRESSRVEIVNVTLLQGDGLTNAEVTSPDSIADYDRREAYQSESGVKDYPTLVKVGKTRLRETDHEQTKWTSQWVRGQGGPEPDLDFGIGDFIRADWVREPIFGLFRPVRVNSIVRMYSATDEPQASVELNDLLLEHDVLLARKIAVATGGSISKSSNATIVRVDPVATASSIGDDDNAAKLIRSLEVPFSDTGNGTSMSVPYLMRQVSHIRGGTFSALTAASTDSVATVYADGTAVGTITLPAGQTSASATFAPNTAGTILTVRVTTAGTGLAGVTVQVDLLRNADPVVF